MSTICKFFLKNSCKFGDRCHYSHILPNEKYHNPYVLDKRQSTRQEGVSIMHRVSPQQTHSATVRDDVEKILPEYMKKVMEDVNQIEEQKMWPLTCFSLGNFQLNLPEWNDISMEELRWEAYQAKANGTMDVYVAKVQELLARAKELREVFLRPNLQAENAIREYLKNNLALNSNQSSPFTIDQPIKNPNELSFASAFEKQSLSTTFNQFSSTSTSQKFFSPNLSSNTFNQGTQQRFFGNRKSFGNASQQPTSQDWSSSMDIGGSSGAVLFNQNSNQDHFHTSSNVCQSSASIPVYSKVEDLSEEDYEAFKANTFTLENLPFLPPPKELCH